jgi:hypothetical protein
MTEVTYTPRGVGCEVRLTTRGGLGLVASVTGLRSTTSDLEGSRELVSNLALVTRLVEYAANELAYRRLRSPEKRASHRQAADRDRRDAVAIAEMVEKQTPELASGWCSGCFERTEHRHVRWHDRPTRKFLCENCGTPTTRCAVPGCRSFAIVNPRALHTLRYCAPHRHDIPSFERLTERLAKLDDAQRWLRFESRNATRITKVAAGTLGAAVVVAPGPFRCAGRGCGAR